MKIIRNTSDVSICFVEMVPYSQYSLVMVSLGLLFTTHVEAFSDDIDNLILPIILFPFLYISQTFE